MPSLNDLRSRALSITAAALFVVVSARLIAHDRRFSVVVALMLVGFAVPIWLARRRMHRLLLSGDIGRILGTSEVAPLVKATAYAAYGFIDKARDALSRAARGPSWEAAIEQRLFIEALLDVFEGDRSEAMTKAETLQRLPLPPNVGFRMRRKISLLRRGVGALTRAFAHASKAEDEQVLRAAGSSSPLVHWAMRYARAIFLIDAGRRAEARDLLQGAPAWPEESAFRSFHDELVAEMG
jgi:hypothetical protein